MYSQLKSCVKVKNGLTQFFKILYLYQARVRQFSYNIFFIYKMT